MCLEDQWLTQYFENQFNPLHKSLLLLERKSPLSSFPLLCPAVEAVSLLSAVHPSMRWCCDMDQALIQGSTSLESTSLAFLMMCRGLKWLSLVDGERGTPLLPMVAHPLLGSTVCGWICVWKGRQSYKQGRIGAQKRRTVEKKRSGVGQVSLNWVLI